MDNKALNIARYVSRVLLGVVFCISAVTKFVSMESFEIYLFSFQYFSFDVCSMLARILIICELLLGLGLVSGFFRKTVNWLCTAMLAVFTVFLLWRVAVGDEGSCHCFGDVLDMNPWQSIIKNAVFAVFLALGWNCWLPPFEEKISNRWRVWIAVIAAVAATATIFIANAPDFYFRLKKGSSDYITSDKWDPVAEQLGCTEGKHVVMILSPLCEHCVRCMAKTVRCIERHNLPVDSFRVIYMDPFDGPERHYDVLVNNFFEVAEVENPGFRIDFLDYDVYIRLTRGLQPFVCLYDGLEKKAEFDGLTFDEAGIVDFLKEE